MAYNRIGKNLVIVLCRVPNLDVDVDNEVPGAHSRRNGDDGGSVVAGPSPVACSSDRECNACRRKFSE